MIQLTKKELIEIKEKYYREGIRATLNFLKNEIGEEKLPLFLKCASDIIDSKLIDEKIIMNNWISVKDGLPELHEKITFNQSNPVICYGADKKQYIATLFKCYSLKEGEIFFWKNEDANFWLQFNDVTHWQPQDKPPEDK